MCHSSRRRLGHKFFILIFPFLCNWNPSNWYLVKDECFTAKKCHILTKCDKFDKRWNIRRGAGESVPTGSIDRNFVRLVLVGYWIFLAHFFARDLSSCKSYKLTIDVVFQTLYIIQQRKKGANMILITKGIIETGYDGSLSTGLSRQIIWGRSSLLKENEYVKDVFEHLMLIYVLLYKASA